MKNKVEKILAYTVVVIAVLLMCGLESIIDNLLTLIK